MNRLVWWCNTKSQLCLLDILIATCNHQPQLRSFTVLHYSYPRCDLRLMWISLCLASVVHPSTGDMRTDRQQPLQSCVCLCVGLWVRTTDCARGGRACSPAHLCETVWAHYLLHYLVYWVSPLSQLLFLAPLCANQNLAALAPKCTLFWPCKDTRTHMDRTCIHTGLRVMRRHYF